VHIFYIKNMLLFCIIFKEKKIEVQLYSTFKYSSISYLQNSPDVSKELLFHYDYSPY